MYFLAENNLLNIEEKSRLATYDSAFSYDFDTIKISSNFDWYNNLISQCFEIKYNVTISPIL